MTHMPERGHESAIKKLLDIRKVDADSKVRDGQAPLSWAAVRGYEAVVQLLFGKRADLDVKYKK
jgi:ankyrin repeat protein